MCHPKLSCIGCCLDIDQSADLCLAGTKTRNWLNVITKKIKYTIVQKFERGSVLKVMNAFSIKFIKSGK